ncbi:MAG: DUF4038 domain-containing protein [Verrucomicrobiota bacterium]|nr:DUF4038 domain-containing protein [Verrucomicrobiota bacterium]
MTTCSWNFLPFGWLGPRGQTACRTTSCFCVLLLLNLAATLLGEEAPAPPSHLSATAASASEIDLAWTDNSDNEEGFYVFRWNYETEAYEWIVTVDADATNYRDSGLAPESTYWYLVAAFTCAGASDFSNEAFATTVRAGPRRLAVSRSGRYLIHADDHTPFFFLGDTAWELFHRLDRAEADAYLENRAGKGFSVIQAVALAELDGLNTPNPYGDRPLLGNDPAQPDVTPGADPEDPDQYDYWDHVDYIVETAAAKGLYIGLLPTWGRYVTDAPSRVFDTTNARLYGEFLGARYKDKPVIWILGGDRNPAGFEEVFREMARGIAIGATGSEDYTQLLMTFHPRGGATSAITFHDDDWLDFNMIQSGHSRWDNPNYNPITADYSRAPTKPAMDGEPRYEDHPVGNPANGYFDDFDVRQGAYWALFAGAHGHTYGHHSIWQFWTPERPPVNSPILYWWDAIDRDGAADMAHVRSLIESRPMLSRLPDQALVAGGQGTGINHIRSTRAYDGSYAFLYLPTGNTVTVDLTRLSGAQVRAWWYDPREGTAEEIGVFERSGTQDFTPPSSGRGNDWVLVLDDIAWEFPAPGAYYEQPPEESPPPPDLNFVLGINFNGGAVTIEGNEWLSYADALANGLSFATEPRLSTTSIVPNPPVDLQTNAMLNTVAWRLREDLTLSQAIDNGDYEVVLFVIENHQPYFRSFDVVLEGTTVDYGIANLPRGDWAAYRYNVRVDDSALDLTLAYQFGDPHLAGLAIYRAESD